MNYIITHRCNKGCSYCFASEHRNNFIKNKSPEMSIDAFREFLSKEKDDSVKLLGGEPTSHPNFDKILEIILKESNKNVTIISNFLFTEDVLKILIHNVKEFLSHGRKIAFLVNSSELNIKNRMEVFKRNYIEVYSLLYALDKEKNINCGITVEEGKDAKFYVEYIEYLLSHIKRIENFRISLNFPGTTKDKKSNLYINNKKIGKIIIILIKYLNNRAIPVNLDCILFPCMFENKEQYKYVTNFLQNVRFNCEANAPTDVFEDGSAIYRYPLKDSIKTNINKHKHSNALRDDLVLQYKIIEQNIDKPKECIDCKYLLRGECAGPCLAMYPTDEINDLGLVE